MSHHFAKPENALKRAEELLHVGQQQAALDSLHDVLSSKRHRTWTPVIEHVITKYLDICIALKKGRAAKDGLIQYRIICQQVNVGSLEDVLRHFMDKVDSEATAAMAGAEDVAQSLVSDLDADETPESILLSAMTGDDAATRSEREAVTPWLKFIWETYRTVLEILRSNQKLESLYTETANKAFAFCVKYKRATEMRRLCELLRNHLAALSKFQPREAAAAGLPVDGLGMHLEVRYSQLNAAADLELWQESYRTIEDIHALTVALKKPPKTSMQLLYYAKLSQVFLVSDNLLLHAYCLGRLVALTKAKKSAPDPADLQSLATAALLAAAIAPLSPAEAHATAGPAGRAAATAPSLDLDLDAEKHRRIAAVLGFGAMPSRDSLLAELRAKGVFQAAEPRVAALVEHLEASHVPMGTAREAEAVLGWMEGDSRCRQYGAPLRRQVAVRLLQQMGRVYTALSLEKAVSLIRVLPADEAELVMARAAKRGLVSLCIDAAAGKLSFAAHSLAHDAAMRSALSTLFVAVGSAATRAAREAIGEAQLAGAASAVRAAALAKLAEGASGEHARMLQRKLVIERRKEDLERALHRREEARRERAEQEAAEAQEQEKARLSAEARRRELEKAERERAEEEHDSRRKLAEALAEQRKTLKKQMKKSGWDIETDVDKLAEMPVQALVTEQRELMADERAEFEKRLETLRKRADYLERARREAEAPLLRTAREFSLRADKEQHERNVRLFIEQAQAQRVHALAERERLKRVVEDKSKFEQQRFAARQAIHEAACAARNEALREAREARRDERREARARRKAMAAAAAAEEAARAEAARIKEEREAARRAAIEAERAKALEAEERKRAKEAEVEIRLQAERLEATGPTWADREGEEEEALPTIRRTAAAASASAADKEPPKDKERGAAAAPPPRQKPSPFGAAAPGAGATGERSWENQPLRDSRAGLGGIERGPGERGGERWQSGSGGMRGAGGDDRFAPRGDRAGGDSRFGGMSRDGPPREDRLGGSDRWREREGPRGDARDDRFAGRGGGGDDRFAGRGGGGDARFGSRGGGDDRFGSRGGGDDRFAGRGGGDDRFAGRGGGDDRFGGRGGGDDRFAGRGGGDDRFGSRGGGDDRFAGRGGGDRAGGDSRFGGGRDGPPRDAPPRPSASGDTGGRWR